MSMGLKRCERDKAMDNDLRISTARKIIDGFPRFVSCKDPFRVLIGTLLSQRTKDAHTEVAEKNLFEAYATPYDLMKLQEAQLYPLIRVSGMYRQKAARIIEISRILVDEFEGHVPDTIDGLLSLPGVGRKTANIVLNLCFGVPALAVDTHVHRISNRLGWVSTKTPEQTETALMPLIPDSLWGPLNGSMVNFGKEVCKPVHPRCPNCPFNAYCPSSTITGEQQK